MFESASLLLRPSALFGATPTLCARTDFFAPLPPRLAWTGDGLGRECDRHRPLPPLFPAVRPPPPPIAQPGPALLTPSLQLVPTVDLVNVVAAPLLEVVPLPGWCDSRKGLMEDMSTMEADLEEAVLLSPP